MKPGRPSAIVAAAVSNLAVEAASRFRLLVTRLLTRVGAREDSFLLLLAVLVGVVTAVAAVGFHELILFIRDVLFERNAGALFSGWGLLLLALIPAAGGLAVGIISKHIAHAREGHGVVDVMESVVRTSGFVKPGTAVEKIVTSAITIGTGGSAGAEGPIIQIGAAVSSGVGQLFRLARHQMPVLVGCGAAAGISSIFNAPIGGVLFVLEVILLDFSIRTFTPVVVASVIANVTTRALFAYLHGLAGEHGPAELAYEAIFRRPDAMFGGETVLNFPQLGNFLLLGLLCGVVGVVLTRTMLLTEHRLTRLRGLGALRPALGGLAVGVLGVGFVLAGGLTGTAGAAALGAYPMPPFFSDGYGVINLMLSGDFYALSGDGGSAGGLAVLLAVLCVLKVAATCLTLGSGGSGGVIAPSLFLGATAGGLLGVGLRGTGLFNDLRPELYALVGMGAVLAAVVHAPLASVLILFELTQDYRITLAAMLAAVTAVGIARLLFRDSIYTVGLRSRGIVSGSASDMSILRRISVEQVSLEPAAVLQRHDPVQRVLELIDRLEVSHFVVIDEQGNYLGMVVDEDVNRALVGHEAIALLIVDEMMRPEVPLVKTTDDLASIFDVFGKYDVSHLPVEAPGNAGKVIGLISRTALMRKYQASLTD